MVERQNVLSTIMLKKVKLCNENVKLHLATWQHQKYARPHTYPAPYVRMKVFFSFFTVNNTIVGRRSKHSEYDYAQKCQTLQ